MRNPEDIDVSKDKDMQAKHGRVLDVVWWFFFLFMVVLSIEQTDTREAMKALIGAFVFGFFLLAAYWIGRADGEKKQ